jgi:hypothetical protein
MSKNNPNAKTPVDEHTGDKKEKNITIRCGLPRDRWTEFSPLMSVCVDCPDRHDLKDDVANGCITVWCDKHECFCTEAGSKELCDKAAPMVGKVFNENGDIVDFSD